MDPYFINTADLKELGLINNNVEDSILSPTIIRAQRATIRPVLGTSLYKRIAEGIDDDDLITESTLSGWEELHGPVTNTSNARGISMVMPETTPKKFSMRLFQVLVAMNLDLTSPGKR